MMTNRSRTRFYCRHNSVSCIQYTVGDRAALVLHRRAVFVQSLAQPRPRSDRPAPVPGDRHSVLPRYNRGHFRPQTRRGASLPADARGQSPTNASKYGALSIDGGRVNVDWRFDAPSFAMDWTWRGGPPVSRQAVGALAPRSSIRWRSRVATVRLSLTTAPQVGVALGLPAREHA